MHSCFYKYLPLAIQSHCNNWMERNTLLLLLCFTILYNYFLHSTITAAESGILDKTIQAFLKGEKPQKAQVCVKCISLLILSCQTPNQVGLIVPTLCRFSSGHPKLRLISSMGVETYHHGMTYNLDAEVIDSKGFHTFRFSRCIS